MAAIDITGAGGGITTLTGTSPVVITNVGLSGRNVALDQTQFKTINGNSIFGAGNIVIGLTNWTEAYTSNPVGNTSSFTALGAGTNINAAIIPKGTGAIVADIADGAATGGNARGQYAVDFQMQRSNANQVASGDFSVICGGTTNLCADSASFIGGGGDIQIAATSLNYNVVIGGVTQRINAGTGGRNYIGGGESQTISGTSRNSIIGSGANQSINGNYNGIFSGQGNTNNGIYSVIPGGQLNTITSQWGITNGYGNSVSGFYNGAFGLNNTVSNYLNYAFGESINISGNNSYGFGAVHTITAAGASAFGVYGNSYLYGQQAHANGRFSITGDAQGSETILRLVDGFTDAQTKELFLDGSSLRITGPTNSAMTVNIDIVAIVTAISGTATGVSVGDMFSQNMLCAYKNIGGTGSIVGTPFSIHKLHDASMAACDTTFTVTGAALQVNFLGPNFAGGGTVTLRVVAKARIVETRY